MVRRLIACLFLFCPALDAAELQKTVPEHFRGTWASSVKDCDAIGAESKLTIGETGIDFYESRGRILAIATEGTNELGLLMELTGEGKTWLDARKFTLSQDGQTLTYDTGGEHTVVRMRCEAHKRVGS